MNAIYATFDELGLPTGFYHIGISKTIPEDAIQITEEQWRDFISNMGQKRWDGANVVEYVYEQSDDDKAANIRAHRDRLLAETDYLLMPDYPLAGESLDALAVYRQALRDITKQETFPQSVVWPEKPEI